MIKHIVFMKFKPEVTDLDINDLQKGLGGLPGLIQEIKSYEFGKDIIHSERSYDFALISAFENLDALNKYQGHPDHVVVVQKVRNMCQSILAVDFEY